MPRSPLPLARYRRRAWTIGVVLALVLFVVGAPRYVESIERDLEERVPAELADLGIVDVSAAFSGQDGTLTCTEPLTDPEAALAAAFDVRGVRNVELDRSCRVRTAADVGAAGTTLDDGSTSASSTDAATDAVADAGDEEGGDAADATDPVVEPTPTPPIELSIPELIDSDSDLSLLSVMLRESDLIDVVGGDDVTFFAPTNAAFDALPADELALMRGEPELMRRVMEHHVVEAPWLLAELIATGEVVASDGTPVVVESSDQGVTVGGALVSVGDITASNGVMHMIDGLMVPDDLDLTPLTGPPVEATSADGVITLTGVVATEVDRLTLTQAAGAGDKNVDDQLTVDSEIGLDDDITAQLAGLVDVLATQLADGSAAFDGSDLVLAGTYRTDEQRAAAESAGATVDATVELSPAASPDSAPQTQPDPAAIEAGLNELVTASPILFQSRSDVLDASAAPTLDQLADRLAGLSGVTVTIEGHTDSDGSATNNQALSLDRAEAVLAALVERGVAADLLVAEGLGSAEPVLVDGVEDKAASRRVEFRVVVAP